MTKISKITALTALITLAFGMTVIGNAVAEEIANTAKYNDEIQVTYAANGDIIKVKPLDGCREPKRITISSKDRQLPADLSMDNKYKYLDIINANLLRVHNSPQGCYYYNPYTGRWECICCY